MSEYASASRTVVVGTDRSESSLRTAARAGALAAASDATLVGNRGLNGIKGRLLGSVPADATRRSQCDVLILHTTG